MDYVKIVFHIASLLSSEFFPRFKFVNCLLYMCFYFSNIVDLFFFLSFILPPFVADFVVIYFMI